MLARVLTAIVGIPLMLYVACVDSAWPLRAFCTVLFIAVAVESWAGVKQGTRKARVATPLVFLVWCAGIAALYAISKDKLQSDGSWFAFHTGPLLLLLITIWAGDTAAMLIGRRYGKHKLAKRISPQKTWEGSISNFVAAAVCGWAFAHLGTMPPLSGLLFGSFSGVFGQLGDLLESAWKRECGIKDSGNLLPGHGGVLDRFDSLLFAALIQATVFPVLFEMR